MKKLFAGFILITLAPALLFCPAMQAQVAATTYGNFAGTGVSNSYSHATSYTINSTPIEIRKDRGLALLPFVAGSANATNLATFTFEVSADGTNYSNDSSEFTAIFALSNNTNIVARYANFDKEVLNNAKYIRMSTLTTANTNTVTLIRMQWSRHE